MTIVDGSVIKSYFETGDVPTETQFSNMIDTFLQIQDSWVLDEDDWVYVSANSFKIEGKDVTSKFPTGTKIKCTNSTVKYFNVVSSVFSTDTTVTIFGAGTYSLANTAISSNYYSYAEFARSFPSLMTTLSQLQTGWILDSNTWIYSSATSITVSGKDVTSYFPIGTKIKFTQTTVKYFVVADASYASDTILTLTGDTVANATINDFYYSHAMVANGAPDTGGVWKNYTPVWTAATTNPSIGNGTLYGRYCVIGKLLMAKIFLQFGSSSTAGSGAYSFTYPIVPANYRLVSGEYRLRKNGGNLYEGGIEPFSATVALIRDGGTYVTNTTPFGFANLDIIGIGFSYEI
jgi:hypothetical protein